ncbi:hypothetical protein ORJ04_22535 [Rheinheimera baltica]|uniref:Uncharacterized protein n=1 Tax=Rheinheimera baltica TaxID=67576 RepID=A0ABT9I5Q1_9GAMM|nr:hypothetical protein [Rheinheimera baltica]MDP5138727.1 hypothetical protein [Rheinheimera baltica]MDP5149289.1 hypothetical protein [Rheinheimera baltica]
MNIEDYVKNYTEEDELKILFAWNGKHGDDFMDENLKFRREVIKYFESGMAIFPLSLISALYDAETEFAKEAWGVHPVVSKLAKELLERGGSKYVSTYLKGWARGMDAHLQSKQIELSENCINELIKYSKLRKENDEFPNKQQAELFIEFLEYKLAQKH